MSDLTEVGKGIRNGKTNCMATSIGYGGVNEAEIRLVLKRKCEGRDKAKLITEMRPVGFSN